MAVSKISVTVDSKTLKEMKRLSPGVPLSRIIDQALQTEAKRMKLQGILDEMDRRNPISARDYRAGEALWTSIESSWTQARSRRSRKKTAAYGPRSGRR